MRVENLYRYPVKGLSAEPLDAVVLQPGQTLPWDRTFALAQGDSGFDPAAPVFLRKSNFMCLLKNERIAALDTRFDDQTGILFIQAPGGAKVAASPLTPVGRIELGAFLTDFLGDEARGTPVFHHVPGHHFTDDRAPLVSLLSLDTLRRVEADLGAPRDPIRFRSNLQFSGSPPWAEFDWVDLDLRVGAARLRIVKRTRRCNATQVNPVTAQRDADPVRELMRHYGHPDLGVLATVVEGGRVAVGDALSLA